MTKISQPIFYFEKLKTWDRVTIILYVILSAVIWYYFNNTINKDILLFGYALGTQFFIYFFNYKSLRNLKVYIFWAVVGIIHLNIYFHLNGYPLNERGHSGIVLKNTLVLLLLYQVLRFISIKTQGKELVCPSKGSRTDLFEERDITFIDYILFAIYIGSTMMLLFIDSMSY